MISVIVPVYNTEKYLRKCIDSIIEQTYKEIDVILIDDGSTDSSGTICDEYAERFKNIRAYHQENKGLVSARKLGVTLAKGDYVTFVDSDDWIEKDCYQSLVPYFDNGIDMVSYGMILEDGIKIIKYFDTVAEGYYFKKEIRRKIFPVMAYDANYDRPGIIESLCNKILKKELLDSVIQNIDEKITYGEDATVVYSLISRINKIYITHYCGYHYIQYKNSMSHVYNIESFERILDFQKCIEKELLAGKKDVILQEQINRYVYSLLKQTIFDVYNINVPSIFYLFPYHKIPIRSKIILYGAGKVGKAYWNSLKDGKYSTIVAWVDKNYDKDNMLGVENPQVLMEKEFDYVVVAVENESIAIEIINQLTQIGVNQAQVCWEKPMRVLADISI